MSVSCLCAASRLRVGLVLRPRDQTADAGDPRQERREALGLFLQTLGADLGVMIGLHVAQRGALAELAGVEIEAVLVQIGSPGGLSFETRACFRCSKRSQLRWRDGSCLFPSVAFARLLRLPAFLQLFPRMGLHGFDVAQSGGRVIGEPVLSVPSSSRRRVSWRDRLWTSP